MLDDERYPTAVFPENDTFAQAPEVAPNQYLDYTGREKLSPDKQSTLLAQPQPDLIPVEGSQYNSSHHNGYDGLHPVPAAESTSKPTSRTCCGLKRKTFIIVVAVAAVVIIGAVVGGVVGGLKSKDSSSSSSSETPAAPKETGPIDPIDRGMAVALGPNWDEQNQHLQLFYQDLKTPNISYRPIHNDQGGDEYTLKLDIEPGWGTPMAAVGLESARNAQLFYLAVDSDNSTIVQATLDCSSDPCDVLSNNFISTNASTGINEDTKLAALRLGGEDGNQVRVYFQAPGNHIWALSNNDANFKEWTSNHVIDNGSPGTGIVSVGANSSDINIFYVSSDSQRLRQLTYSDNLGANPDADGSVYESPGSSWNPSVSLAGIFNSKVNPYRVYYANPNGKEALVSFFKSEEEDVYNTNQDPTWGTIQGGFAAASWADQVRIYYFNEGKLVSSAQNASVWSGRSPV